MKLIPNTIPNIGLINYQYQIDPSLPFDADSSSSNVVITNLRNANVSIKKLVNLLGADLNDILIYTLVLENSGNISADNLSIIDTIPIGTNFIPNSVVVDNIPAPGSNPENPGISMNNLPAGGVSTISFNIQVYTIPKVNPVPNNAILSYYYTVDPSTPNGKFKTSISNTVTVPVSHADIYPVKSVDKNFITVGDTITYSIVLSNSGNVAAKSVQIYDTIPNSTNFVLDSVYINGLNVIGVNPQSGLKIDTIPAGEVATITFKVVVPTIPQPNPIFNNANILYKYTVENIGDKSVAKQSNSVNTKVNLADIFIKKEVDKNFVDVNSQITYTLTLTNSGNVKADNLIVYDTIPLGSTFVKNSVTIAGVPAPGVNPTTGIIIGSIDAGKSLTISFSITSYTVPCVKAFMTDCGQLIDPNTVPVVILPCGQVTGNPTVSCDNPLVNQACGNYTFVVDTDKGSTLSKSTCSNIVQTTVATALLKTSKATSVDYSDVNSEITYTITFNNIGNIPTSNTMFFDTIPAGTVFVPGSVTLNNSILNTSNPQAGILIGSIYPFQPQTLTFRIKVTTIPNLNPIKNQGVTNYSYEVDPIKHQVVDKETSTNIVCTKVNNACIYPVKSVDKSYATVGETITYTINLTNLGNTSANNIIFKDTLPKEAIFINGSVKVNGANKPGSNPVIGIPVDTLNPSEISTIEFKAVVATIPINNPIPNEGYTTFNYTVDPNNLNGSSGETKTNIVSTTIVEAKIIASKAVDLAYSDLDELLTYTITVQNTGNTVANNVVVFDTLPTNTTFIPNSVEINGATIDGDDPLTGIYIGSLLPMQEALVTYKVMVNSIPAQNKVLNSADVAYAFTTEPSSPNSNTRRITTNLVETTILSAIIKNEAGGLVKSVDKSYCAVNDILTYSIALKNTGNTAANKVVIYDIAPDGTTFVPDSMTVDGIQVIGANIGDGYEIGTIVAGNTVIVTFKVKVNTIPTKNPILNQADVSYVYTSDPSNPDSRSQRHLSNIVSTLVQEAIINKESGGFIKSVDKLYGIVDDILTYSILLKNTGNTIATNIIVRDSIPNNTVFVNGSVVIDGVEVPSGNPQMGILVSDIPANSQRTLLFKVKVLTLPTPNPILNEALIQYNFTSNPTFPNGNIRNYTSNEVKTKINIAKIDTIDNGFIKKVDKEYAKVGEIITYNILMTNTGNVDAKNILFYDSIPAGTSFVENSVKIDNVTKPGYNPAVGFNIGDLGVKETRNVSFQVIVDHIPTVNPIPNTSTVTFNYVYNPVTSQSVVSSGQSNQVSTTINEAFIKNSDGGFIKSVDKEYATVGDILNFKINLKNTGNVTANNIVVMDALSSDLEFIPNSLKINEIITNYNPNDGIKINNLTAGQQAEILFQAKVLSVPSSNPIVNKASISYRFTKNPQIPNGEYSKYSSNETTTQIYEAMISTINDGLIKSADKSYLDIGDTITFSVKMTNTGNTEANNIILFDTVPDGFIFVNNSVTVNGINSPLETPESGIIVGNLQPNSTSVITFICKVLNIPAINPITNVADVAYTFVYNPLIQSTTSRRNTSNSIDIKVNHAELKYETGGFTKAVDKLFADINEPITYNMKLINTGNIKANNVVLTDSLPAGATFVLNSVKINGVSEPSSNPLTGVFIDEINPSEVVDVSFIVVVPTLPTVNPVVNKATLNYSYTVNPENPNSVTAQNVSNTVATKINTANLQYEDGGISKFGDRRYADLGDTITYSIVLFNKGNVSATNVSVIDTIPTDVTFIKDSVKVNGAVLPGVTPGDKIGIGVINSNEKTTITFMVLVNSLPKDKSVENFANVKYSYTKNPTFPNGQSKSSRSNIFVTTISNATISKEAGGLSKTVSKEFADLGDILTYTFYLKNTGNTDATNVVLSDTIGDGTVFIKNSASVDGVISYGENPEHGISVGTIKPNETAIVRFNVSVTNIPTLNPIPDIGKVSYNYTVNPNQENGYQAENYTNKVYVKINHGEISNENNGLIKSADKEYVQIGDVITYTINMTNTGNVQVDNVIVQDTIPKGTELLTNSILLNSIPILGSDPNIGINVGTINSEATAVLSFKVLVVSIVDNNYPPIIDGLPCYSAPGQSGLIENMVNVCYRYTVDPKDPCGKSTCNQSNTTKTKINTAIINMEKKSTPLYVDLNEKIAFTLHLENIGNEVGTDITLKDNLSKYLNFIPDSIKVNGISQPGANIINGIHIAPMQPYGKSKVEFLAEVTSIPPNNEILNSALVNYSFILNPTNGAKGSNSTESNETINYINHGNIKGTKSVDTAYASAGETLTYTITLINDGNTKVNNVNLYDTLEEGIALVQGSVFVNGVQKLGANPQYGLFIGSLNPNDKTTIMYKVLVSDTIIKSTILNSAETSYTYTVDPNVIDGVSITSKTNVVETKINDAIISNATNSFIKTASKTVVDIGEKFTYTIMAKNIGTVAANNVIIKDVLEDNLEFVSGSLQINGIPKFDPDLTAGISVGSIEPENAATVIFEVKVLGKNESGLINNVSTINYSYIKVPNIPIEVSKEEVSNNVVINIVSGEISNLTKTSDKKYAKVGDIIKFTISGKNTGNIDLVDVLINDNLNDCYQFVKDSITVNGLLRLNENIESGVVIPLLSANKEFFVTFKAVVISVPKNQSVPNKATASFEYIVDNTSVSKVINSTESIVFVREANLTLEKLANVKFAQLGDVVSFYLTVKNLGNTTANNITFEDELPAELEFVPGSILVNGNPEPIASISDGLDLENMDPLVTNIIQFDAKVVSIPDFGIVSNTGYLKYNYTVDPTKPPIIESAESNSVEIEVNSTNLKFIKALNTQYAAIGDKVVFDFTIENNGNLVANNVIFMDTLPKEISFIQNSVIVNGIPVPEVDPTVGINIGTVAIDEIVNIKFSVTVNDFGKNATFNNIGLLTFSSKVNPTEAQVKGSLYSNSVQIIVRSPNVSITKDSNYHTAIVGDKVHYTIMVSNTGNIPIENVSIVDILASNLSFISDSVKVNGESMPSGNPSKGIKISKVDPLDKIYVEFDATIILSSLTTATNSSVAYYNYYVNPNLSPREGKITSNLNTITIENVDITVTKSADKTIVILDDNITYTVDIVNNGSVSASNVEFIDSLPDTVTVVPGSFTVDGIVINNVDIADGVNIGSISPKTTKVIKYSVQVKDVDCSGLVVNCAYVLFNVNISPDAPVRRVQATPSSLSIKAASPRFKELNIDKILSIPCNKPDMEDINDLITSVEILNFYVIKTMKGISSEGKRLTGYKLVVNGLINYTLEYTADVCSQSVHSAQYSEKFSSYIIVDEGGIPCPQANIVADIEDISWNMLDKKSVFTNITMNLVIN